MYSHPLLVTEHVSVSKIDEVVDEQIRQQFPPDQLVNRATPSAKESKN